MTPRAAPCASPRPQSTSPQRSRHAHAATADRTFAEFVRPLANPPSLEPPGYALAVEPTTPPTPAARPRSLFVPFLIVTNIVLCVLSLVLVRQNRDLRAQREAAEVELLRERTRGSLGPGEKADPLTIIGPDGQEAVFEFAAPRPTLLLLVSSTCPHCDEAAPLWQKVLEQTSTRDLDSGAAETPRLLCVQSDATRPEQLKPARGPMVPRIAKDGSRTWLRKIGAIPAAVYIGSDGVVRKAWYGVPTERDEREIAEALLGNVK